MDGQADMHKWIQSTTILARRKGATGLQPFNWAKKTPIDRDWIYMKKGYVWVGYPKSLKWD